MPIRVPFGLFVCLVSVFWTPRWWQDTRSGWHLDVSLLVRLEHQLLGVVESASRVKVCVCKLAEVPLDLEDRRVLHCQQHIKAGETRACFVLSVVGLTVAGYDTRTS